MSGGRYTVAMLGILLAAAILLLFPMLVNAGYNNAGSVALVHEIAGTPQNELPNCYRRAPSRSLGYVKHVQAWDGGNTRVWTKLGQSLWLEGRCVEAVAAWEKAVRLEPGNQIAWLDLGHGYYAIGQQQQAINAYQKAGAAGYLLQKGQEARERGAHDLALVWYELSYAAEPSMLTAKYLARQYMQLGQPKSAAAVWHELEMPNSADLPDYWWALGEAARVDQDWEKALEAYREGAALAPNVNFYTRQAEALAALGDLSQAILMYKRAIALRPDYVIPYLSIGDLEWRRQDHKTAKAWYHKADEVAPSSDIRPKLSLGRLVMEEGDLEEAKVYLQAAKEQQAHNPEVYYSLAEVAYRQSELDRAIEYMERVLELDKGKPWRSYMILGDWYSEAGHKGKAIAAYEQALEWNPGQADLKTRLADLR